MKNIRDYNLFIIENQNYPWAGNLTEKDFKRLASDFNFYFFMNFFQMLQPSVEDPFEEIGRYIEDKLKYLNYEDPLIKNAPSIFRYSRIFNSWISTTTRHDLIDMFGDPYYWESENDLNYVIAGGLWLKEEDRNLGMDPDYYGCSWFVRLGGVMTHIFYDRLGVKYYFKMSRNAVGTIPGLEKATEALKDLVDIYARNADWGKMFD